MQAKTYPGTLEHRRLLRAIADYYAADDRILAVGVFGSLGRGTWDEYSDLDLDVVVADGLTLNVTEEVWRLCHGLEEEPVAVVRDHDDAADIVLASLMQLSIRYHPLSTTSPNIVDSLLVLTGRLDHAAIVAAGLENRRLSEPGFPDLVEACIRQVVTVDAALHRQRFWSAYLVLHEARERLLRLLAAGRGARRPYHALEQLVDPWLQSRFRRTLPHDDLPSLQQAFVSLLDLLEHDLEALSGGQARLTGAQGRVVAQVRARQATLDLRAE